VPTTAEAGFPELKAGAIFGIYVAAGTPNDIVQKLNTTVNGVIVLPEVTEQLRKLGAEPSPKTVTQFTQLIHKEIQLWREVVTKAKLPTEEY
jgi:tripartite-type tricarboxylate transporter receptor subunit TctC